MRNNGRCISGRLEVQLAVLPLHREFKRRHPDAPDAKVRKAAYETFRAEMVRQTIFMKSAIFSGRTLWNK